MNSILNTIIMFILTYLPDIKLYIIVLFEMLIVGIVLMLGERRS